MKMNYVVLSVTILVAGVQFAKAQTIGVSCPYFFKDRHQALACTEALFSQDKYHFTLASLPPANGFGPGIVFEKKSENISNPDPSNPNHVARRSALDLSLTLAATTNSSWLAGGDLRWLPPLAYRADPNLGVDMKHLGKLTVTEVASIHLSTTHRTVRTLYFYGEGSRSANTQYHFAQDDTYFDASGRMPLTPWLAATGESEVRATELPAIRDVAAVSAHFSAAPTPGLANQPLFLHNAAGVSTSFSFNTHGKFVELPSQNDPHFMSQLHFDFKNDFSYHWHVPADGSPLAFQQFVHNGEETIAVHNILRNFFPADKHPLVRYICESNKSTHQCDFGQFDVKTRLVLTHTGGANQVPFYLQPTLGGSDIDSRITLRGYENYRFRGNDLALAQFEYGFPVYEPFGAFVFYDAGTVGNTASDLTLPKFRQDAGPGISVRIRGQVVGQAFYAFGGGHGGRFGFNFGKVF